MQQTLGAYLRKTRIDKNITLEEASFNTKVRIQYLKSLEEDEINALPSKVQGKGYLRLYAEYLGIDEKLILSAWADPNLLVPTPEPQDMKPEEEAQPVSIPTDQKKNNQPETNQSVLEFESQVSQSDEQEVVDLPKYIHYQDQTAEPVVNPDEIIENLTGSVIIFKEIGETLKQTRLSLHLSVDEIEKYTNIRSHYLNALENGKLDQLPSPVQGRGMLSNYANFLNLNTEKLLTRFAEGLQTRREELLSPDEKKKKSNSENQPASQAILATKKYLSLDFIMTIVLIMGVFSIILFAAAQITSPRSETETTQNPPSISDVLLQETAFTPEANITPTIAPNQVLNTENGVGLETNNENNETFLPEGDLPLQVYVIAKQRVFLQITADDEVVFSGRTVPGNAYEFSAEQQITLLTGNASGIDVYFNQELVGNLGDIGEVKNYLFTLEQGMITATPRFSPTPTNTLQPTATETPMPSATPTIAVPTATVTPLIP